MGNIISGVFHSIKNAGFSLLAKRELHMENKKMPTEAGSCALLNSKHLNGRRLRYERACNLPQPRLQGLKKPWGRE